MERGEPWTHTCLLPSPTIGGVERSCLNEANEYGPPLPRGDSVPSPHPSMTTPASSEASPTASPVTCCLHPPVCAFAHNVVVRIRRVSGQIAARFNFVHLHTKRGDRHGLARKRRLVGTMAWQRAFQSSTPMGTTRMAVRSGCLLVAFGSQRAVWRLAARCILWAGSDADRR